MPFSSGCYLVPDANYFSMPLILNVPLKPKVDALANSVPIALENEKL